MSSLQNVFHGVSWNGRRADFREVWQVCCNVLQLKCVVAVCCGVLQCVAVRTFEIFYKCVAVCCSWSVSLQGVAACCSVLQCVLLRFLQVCCSVLQFKCAVAVSCSALQYIAVCTFENFYVLKSQLAKKHEMALELTFANELISGTDPPKNGVIALWTNTRVVKCKYYVSQKQNGLNNKIYWYSILLTFIFKFTARL